MHLAFITLMMCVTYFILLFLFPLFFAQKTSPLLRQGYAGQARRNPLPSLVFIVILSALAFAISFSIQDLELGNRILHIFGGGFLGFFVCFLAARDSRVNINKFQFLVFSALVVLALGTANELFELVLQNCFGIVSAASVDDTWLDLASNVVGVIIATVCLVPFHKGDM